jgi:hypothetical protein
LQAAQAENTACCSAEPHHVRLVSGLAGGTDQLAVFPGRDVARVRRMDNPMVNRRPSPPPAVAAPTLVFPLYSSAGAVEPRQGIENADRKRLMAWPGAG